jgi:hypothetical protein
VAAPEAPLDASLATGTPSRALESSIHRPPEDAPSATADGLRLPPPPSGFKHHSAGWIEYAYPPEVRSRLTNLMEVAETTRADLTEKLGRPVLTRVHVRVARTPREMATLAPENAPYPKYAAGVAYSELGLILLTLDPVHPNQKHDVVETFKHELGHVALHDAVAGRPVPRWFNEGFAVFVSGESSLPRLQTLWTATVSGNLIPFDRLERSFPEDAQAASIAYAQAADIVRYLVRHQDRYRFDALVEQLAKGKTFDQSLLAAYDIDRRSLEAEWREDVSKRYTYWPILTSTAVLWTGIVVLFFVAYRRRKRRNAETLERWRKEEANEDARMAAREAARRALFEQALREASAMEPERRVHIVVASPTAPNAPKPRPPMSSTSEIPTVEHDGGVHTLH